MIPLPKIRISVIELYKEFFCSDFGGHNITPSCISTISVERTLYEIENNCQRGIGYKMISSSFSFYSILWFLQYSKTSLEILGLQIYFIDQQFCYCLGDNQALHSASRDSIRFSTKTFIFVRASFTTVL